jgi:hypothetical protein
MRLRGQQQAASIPTGAISGLCLSTRKSMIHSWLQLALPWSSVKPDVYSCFVKVHALPHEVIKNVRVSDLNGLQALLFAYVEEDCGLRILGPAYDAFKREASRWLRLPLKAVFNLSVIA